MTIEYVHHFNVHALADPQSLLVQGGAYLGCGPNALMPMRSIRRAS